MTIMFAACASSSSESISPSPPQSPSVVSDSLFSIMPTSTTASTTTTMSTMTVDDLRDYLESKEDIASHLLVLDCRPFLAYNEAHVSSAVNAYCPSILRRRAGRGGKLPFHVLIPSADVRDGIRRGHYATVVLYDENGGTSARVNVMSTPSTVSNISPSEVMVKRNVNMVAVDDHSAVRVATRCLSSMQSQQQQTDVDAGIGKSVFYLDGGFQKFRQKYPHLCVGSHIGTPGSVSASINSMSVVSPTLQELKNVDQPSLVTFNPVYEQGDPVEILSYLFLGSAFHAANFATLDRLGVTALLNVSRSRPPLAEAFGKFAYKSIPVDDSNSVDISSWFNEAIHFIDEVKECGGKVLVHCHAGISRSATICLAYLMFTRRIRLDEAYEYVKTRRSIISPNFNFMGQLLKFESQVMISASPVTNVNIVDVVNVNDRTNNHKHNHGHSHNHRHRHHYHQHQHQHENRPQNQQSIGMATSTMATNQQRFVFDLGVSEDRGYSSSSVTSSSASPILSPLIMCSTTVAPAIMSPS